MLTHKLTFDCSECISFVKGLRRLGFINLIHLIHRIEDINKVLEPSLNQVLETGFQELQGDYGLLCYKTRSYEHCVTVLPDNRIYDAQTKEFLSKDELDQEGITCVMMFKLLKTVLLEWLKNCGIDTCNPKCPTACVW